MIPLPGATPAAASGAVENRIAFDEAAIDRGSCGFRLRGIGPIGPIGICSISCNALRSTTDIASVPLLATTSVSASAIAIATGRLPTRIGGRNDCVAIEKTSI